MSQDKAFSDTFTAARGLHVSVHGHCYYSESGLPDGYLGSVIYPYVVNLDPVRQDEVKVYYSIPRVYPGDGRIKVFLR